MISDDDDGITWTRLWQLVAIGALMWVGLVALGVWIVR